MPQIIVIDDDEQVRLWLKLALERAGHEVLDARDGQQGIKLLRNNPADLVITDIVMPEKEGIETIIELRNQFPDLKIIAISGGGRNLPENYLDMAAKLGADRTFTKPIQREELLDAIKDLLGSD
ncbi:MAG: response regulator [Deltaproteobacteria bacterium]|nr:response regulator [Deltaproteobacteria bacterium]